MAKIEYVNKRMSDEKLLLIGKCNEITADYEGQGYDLTLRQLYYQLVSKDLIENKQSVYKSLGVTISDARLAGLVDWYSIVDRTRALRGNNHWSSPAEIIKGAATGYKIDMWENQDYRVEVWVEKDALTGIISRTCKELDIDYFSCRGYSSQSSMWRAAQRLKRHDSGGRTPVILHLGDHDPSGIDMTRDIGDRLEMFDCYAEVERIALNMDQVRKYSPPPNPAKVTDSRASKYIEEYGASSWELDALEPSVLDALIKKHVAHYRDDSAYAEREAKLASDKKKLAEAVGWINEQP